jgi:thioredoxin reductase
MTDQHYDAIIVGSGAGGAATAFNLVRAGKRALEQNPIRLEHYRIS